MKLSTGNLLKNIYLKESNYSVSALHPKPFLKMKSASLCPRCGNITQMRSYRKGIFLYLQRRCNFCYANTKIEIIYKVDKITENYFWKSPIVPLINKQTYFKGLKAIDVFITKKCDSNCKVCFIKWPGENLEEMTLSNYKTLLQKLNGAKVVLNGGEATLREDIEEFIETTVESGNHPVVYTNGLRFSNRSYLHRLKKHGLKEVVLSFEGFGKKYYDMIRGGGYQYELVLKALENLKEEKIKTSLYCTIVKGVNEDQIPIILRYAASHKFIWTIAFKPLYLPGTSPSSSFSKDNLISYEEIIDLASKEIPGLTVEYILSNQKIFYYMQKILANKTSPIYLSWLEIPSVYLRRNKNRLNLLIPPTLLKNFDTLPWSYILKFLSPFLTIFSSHTNFTENLLYRSKIMKLVMGIIEPCNSQYIGSSPTIRQINGKLYFSSYLAY